MKPLRHHDLIEALAQPGCALCRMLRADVAAFIDSLLYEYAADPQIHETVRAGRGLCNIHSWQARRRKGGSSGLALLYEGVLRESLRQLEPGAGEAAVRNFFGRLAERRGPALAAALSPQQPCICCAHLSANEARYLETLRGALEEAPVRALYAQSQGLCLPHLRLFLAEHEPGERLEWLLATQRGIWEKLIAELQLFRAKSDPRYSEEAMGAEGDSWIRALEAVAGAAEIFGLNRP